jgi:hypothetical protein
MLLLLQDEQDDVDDDATATDTTDANTMAVLLALGLIHGARQRKLPQQLGTIVLLSGSKLTL